MQKLNMIAIFFKSIYFLLLLHTKHFKTDDDELLNLNSVEANLQNKIMVEADPVYLCAKGFTLQNKKCVKIEYLDAKLGCKQDSMTIVNNTCVSLIVKTPRYHCSDPHSMVKDKCVKTLIAPRFAVCPHNYVISEHKSCVLDVKTISTPKCVGSDQKCKQDIKFDSIKSCPENYELVNDLCEKKETAEAFAVCPDGYEFSANKKNHCFKIEKIPASPTCPEGYNLHYDECQKRIKDDSCIKHFKQPRIKHCLENSKPIYKCPENMILIEAKKITVSPKDNYGCVELDIFPPHHECVIDKESDACSTKLANTVKIHNPLCHFGYKHKINENKCEMINLVEPHLTCIEDSIGDICYKVESVPIELGCPPSYTLNYDTCENHLVTKAQLKCEEFDGFMLHENETCIRYNYLKPKCSCPEDLNLTDDEKSCIGFKYSSPIHECPLSFTVHEDHKGKISCLKQLIEKPELKCSKGFVQVKDECQKKIEEPAIKVCDRDYDLEFDQCVKEAKESPVLMCPIGTKYRGSDTIDITSLNKQNKLCEHMLRMNPTLVCPSEFKLHNNTCYKYISKTSAPLLTNQKLLYAKPENPYIKQYYITPNTQKLSPNNYAYQISSINPFTKYSHV